MLRLRRLASEVVSDATANRTDGVADAGAGVILSAICAMKVPSPIMIAAKIIMLRITSLSIAGSPHEPTSSRSRRNFDRRHATRTAILAKRMSEGLTSPPRTVMFPCYVPLGLTRRVGIALAGSSGHG